MAEEDGNTVAFHDIGFCLGTVPADFAILRMSLLFGALKRREPPLQLLKFELGPL